MKERVTMIIELVSADGMNTKHIASGTSQADKDAIAKETADMIAEVLNDLFSQETGAGFKMIASVESAEYLED